MGRIGVIIPVSIHEPLETLIKSADHLSGIDYGENDVRILYVFDGDEKDERVAELKRRGADVLARNTNRGKRAGAINDGLEAIKKFRPDYIAIFDVDSRPSEDFIVKCLEKMKSGVYIASSGREVINPFTIVAEGVFIEYKLIGFLLKKSGFRQFNGLIGLLNPKYIFRYRLNEESITEDADFSTRMHCLGLEAEICDSLMFEQAPVTWKDLFSQRKRWYFGGMELWRYFSDVVKSGNPKFVLSWILALTATYFPVMFLIPSFLTLPALLVRYGKRGVRIYGGLLLHALILQLSSISAMMKFAGNSRVEWEAMRRVE